MGHVAIELFEENLLSSQTGLLPSPCCHFPEPANDEESNDRKNENGGHNWDDDYLRINCGIKYS